MVSGRCSDSSNVHQGQNLPPFPGGLDAANGA
jgi:hypothetical protein